MIRFLLDKMLLEKTNTQKPSLLMVFFYFSLILIMIRKKSIKKIINSLLSKDSTCRICLTFALGLI